jgi:NTP pyrophosphatase (non-canonical NTP hydrolase)
MGYTPLADVRKFHETFAPQQRQDDFLTITERRINLIYEEYEEVSEAIVHLEDTRLNLTSSTMEEAKEELAKELADLLYVVYGTAEELGIPLERVFKSVHQSNMSKVWSDGTVRRNDFGKILKPDTYSPPDLSFIHDDRFLPPIS